MNKKQAYVEKVQAKMDRWDSEISVLEAKAQEAAADAKIEITEQIDALKEQQTEAQNKLDDLRSSSDNAFEDMKDGVDQAWHILERAVENASSRFS